MFLMGHGGCLTCGSTDDDAVRTAGNLLFQQFFQLLVIHLSVVLKWCNQRYTRSFKKCHSLILLIQSVPVANASAT